MGPAGPWKNFATWRRSGNAATLTLFRSDPMNFIIYEPPPFFLLARGRFRLFRLIKFDPLKSRTINQIQYIRRTVFREFTYILDRVGRDGKLLAWISSRANFHYLRADSRNTCKWLV